MLCYLPLFTTATKTRASFKPRILCHCPFLLLFYYIDPHLNVFPRFDKPQTTDGQVPTSSAKRLSPRIHQTSNHAILQKQPACFFRCLLLLLFCFFFSTIRLPYWSESLRIALYSQQHTPTQNSTSSHRTWPREPPRSHLRFLQRRPSPYPSSPHIYRTRKPRCSYCPGLIESGGLVRAGNARLDSLSTSSDFVYPRPRT